jgi:hypothetical protein
VDITYGAEGSDSSAYHVPFSHTDPLDGSAQYFAVQAQLDGSGSVTQSGTASGGYNIASAEVCGDFEGWLAGLLTVTQPGVPDRASSCTLYNRCRLIKRRAVLSH